MGGSRTSHSGTFQRRPRGWLAPTLSSPCTWSTQTPRSCPFAAVNSVFKHTHTAFALSTVVSHSFHLSGTTVRAHFNFVIFLGVLEPWTGARSTGCLDTFARNTARHTLAPANRASRQYLHLPGQTPNRIPAPIPSPTPSPALSPTLTPTPSPTPSPIPSRAQCHRRQPQTRL